MWLIRHDEFIVATHGKGAPKFPGKHSLAKKSEKFLEGRRLDMCRYFLMLLGHPGFLQSSELAILLNKKKNAALADKGANISAISDDAEAAAESGEFDASKFDVSEEWINLNQTAVQSKGSSMSSKLKDSPLNRLQFTDPAWHLDDNELDIAAYEMLFLTVGTSSSLLSPKERETLDVVRAKLGISRKKMKEITHHILNKPSDEVGEEGGGGMESFANTVAMQGHLELLKGQKGQRRFFRLQGFELKHFAKQVGAAPKR